MNKANTQTNSAEIADAYNKFGKLYHESRVKKGRLFNEFLEMPATESLLPQDLTNYIVLDAGCGSGIYARKLARQGARVVGVDVSETMIAIANEEKSAEENITYCVGDLSAMSYQDKYFDLIICNYVLENIDNLQPIFAEFFRILKPGRQCIYSISHPLRAMAKREEMDGREIWQLENYYDRTTRISNFGDGLKIKKYKRTMSDYINSSITAGFVIDKFCEPQPIIAGKENDSVAYEVAMRLPQLLVVSMHRPE